jgi:hypothetical protein
MISATAITAQRELRGKIAASRLADSLAEMGSDLCLEQVPLGQAFQRLQEKALERLVGMLDARIYTDAEAMSCCMDMIADESERLAWLALERGTTRLREGFALLDGLENLDEVEGLESLGSSGIVN